MSSIRIGCGSGATIDPVDGSIDVLKNGNVDYICFDTMAEVVVPGQLNEKINDPSRGYDLMLEERMSAILPLAKELGVKVIGNFGAFNPEGAAKRIAEIAKARGLEGMKIGVITGDDITSKIDLGTPIMGTGQRLNDVRGRFLSGIAYTGAEAVVQCLWEDVDIVVGGRLADAAMYLAPMVHEFGWAFDDWDRLGAGIILGHLAECSSFATGGAWSDPGFRVAPNLARIGRPIIEVNSDLDVFLTKPTGSGGVIAVDNFRAQLMHEIGDPTRYLSPDVVADFTSVTFHQENEDMVSVKWTGAARGGERTSTLKGLASFHEGYLGETMLVLSGKNAADKARLLGEVARDRLLEVLSLDLVDFRADIIGLDSSLGSGADLAPYEVVLRIAGLAEDESTAQNVARFGDYASMIGPVGLGARRKHVAPVIGVYPVLIPRDSVQMAVAVEVV